MCCDRKRRDYQEQQMWEGDRHGRFCVQVLTEKSQSVVTRVINATVNTCLFFADVIFHQSMTSILLMLEPEQTLSQ